MYHFASSIGLASATQVYIVVRTLDHTLLISIFMGTKCCPYSCEQMAFGSSESDKPKHFAELKIICFLPK